MPAANPPITAQSLYQQYLAQVHAAQQGQQNMPAPTGQTITWNTVHSNNLQGQNEQVVIVQQLPDDPIWLDESPPQAAHSFPPPSLGIPMKQTKKPKKDFDGKSTVASVFGVQMLGGTATHKDFTNSPVLLGVEIEVENWTGVVPEGWNSKEDHSLRNSGREFTAGPLYPGQLQPLLQRFCTTAIKQGWHANARTGIHVHINMSDRPLDFVAHFVACYLMAERTLFRYAGEWRRWCNFCHPLEDVAEPLLALKDVLENGSNPKMISQIGKYAGLNITSMATFGTLEVRILPTTFDYAQIVGWINALIGIYETASELHAANTSVGDYVKAHTSQALVNSIFNRHPLSASEFADVVSVNDFRAALPRVKWFQFVCATSWDNDNFLDVGALLTPKSQAPMTLGSAIWKAAADNDWTLSLQEINALLRANPPTHASDLHMSQSKTGDFYIGLKENAPTFANALYSTEYGKAYIQPSPSKRPQLRKYY